MFKKISESASRYKIIKRDEEKRYASPKYLRFSDYMDIPKETDDYKYSVNGYEQIMNPKKDLYQTDTLDVGEAKKDR